MATATRWHSYWLTWPTTTPSHGFRHDCHATLPGVLPWATLVALPAFLFWSTRGFLQGGAGALTLWLGILAELLLLFTILGWTWRRTHRGILIGGGNVVSLGVTQTILWTCLFLSAALAVIMLSGGKPQDLGGDAVLQVGLGVGTLGAGAAISARKKGLTVRPEVRRDAARLMVADERMALTSPARRALRRTGLAHDEPLRALEEADQPDLAGLQSCLPDAAEVQDSLAKAPGGALYSNLCPCQARYLDMLQGDEWANARQLDIGKMQFIAFTSLGLYAYVATLVLSFLHGDSNATGVAVGAYPQGLLEVVGISGAGYLGLKAPVQTPLARARGPLA